MIATRIEHGGGAWTYLKRADSHQEIFSLDPSGQP
jgi:hypothetical protein